MTRCLDVVGLLSEVQIWEGMNVSIWIRQSHRWLSIVFTLTVIANFAYRAAFPGEPPMWLTYSPLPPLFLQLFSGLYLFALPYAAKTAPQRTPT
jgi:hypothetical protein